MNQRALLLLGAVVLLLLFVAYWMITSAGKRSDQPKPKEEKVTVAEAPRTFAMPQLPPPQPIPLAQQPLPPLPQPQTSTMAPAPHGPTLLQRRIVEGDDVSGGGQQASVTQEPQSGPRPGELNGSGPTSAQPLAHADTLMQRGTYIRCVLETHIISDIPGYTSCLVTEPVYSFNGRKLLLPKGSKVLGTYDMQPNVRRVAVIWDRIITPTGIDVNMASPGIDNLGGAGVPGHYDAHWASRISSALLISMLSDAFKYEAAIHGPRTTTISNGFVTQEPFESNTAQSVQNLSNQAVQASANRAATVTINQGTVIYVYVAKDVDFSGVVARF
ncbi:MAG: TrbI/VirB10 family protein [Rhodanobacter sp.]